MCRVSPRWRDKTSIRSSQETARGLVTSSAYAMSLRQPTMRHRSCLRAIAALFIGDSADKFTFSLIGVITVVWNFWRFQDTLQRRKAKGSRSGLAKREVLRQILATSFLTKPRPFAQTTELDHAPADYRLLVHTYTLHLTKKHTCARVHIQHMCSHECTHVYINVLPTREITRMSMRWAKEVSVPFPSLFFFFSFFFLPLFSFFFFVCFELVTYVPKLRGTKEADEQNNYICI